MKGGLATSSCFTSRLTCSHSVVFPAKTGEKVHSSSAGFEAGFNVYIWDIG